MKKNNQTKTQKEQVVEIILREISKLDCENYKLEMKMQEDRFKNDKLSFVKMIIQQKAIQQMLRGLKETIEEEVK